MAQKRKNRLLSLAQFLHLLISIAIGTSFSLLLMLYGFDYFFSGTVLAAVFLLVAAMLTAPIYRYLTQQVLPSLISLPAWSAWLLISVSVLIGAYAILRTPIGLVEDMTAYTGPRLLSQVIVWLATGLVGGFLLVMIIISVIKIEGGDQAKVYIVGAVLFAYLAVGMTIFDDYGMSTDESTQRTHGGISLAVFAPSLAGEYKNTNVTEYTNRYYGVAFTLPLFVVEAANELPEEYGWLTYHYVTFLVVFAGILAIYKLAEESYQGWHWGLAALTMLIISPRIFAESFYNSKDLIFLAWFGISLYFGYRFWRSRSFLWAGLFGVMIAFATAMRFLALGLLAVVLVVVLFELVIKGKMTKPFWYLILPFSLIIFFITYTIISPASWGSPFTHLYETITEFSDYKWRDRIMYLGEFQDGHTLPWHYLPVWMLITIPIPYVVLFAIGALKTVTACFRENWRLFFSANRDPLIYLALYVTPILAIIIIGSTLYNAWRQVAFLYVPFVLVAVYGLKGLYTASKHFMGDNRTERIAGYTLAAVMIAAQLNVVRWMVINHPFQYAYFNPIVELFGGRKAFERDYWRLSTLQGIEYLLENDPRDDLNISPANQVAYTRKIMQEPNKGRVEPEWIGSGEAHYFLELHRHPNKPFEGVPEGGEIICAIFVDDLPILTIYGVDSQIEPTPTCGQE